MEEIQYLYCILRDLSSFYLVTSRVLAPIPHYYYFQGKILYIQDMCVETARFTISRAQNLYVLYEYIHTSTYVEYSTQ